VRLLTIVAEAPGAGIDSPSSSKPLQTLSIIFSSRRVMEKEKVRAVVPAEGRR
jgi:hypothetical protein